MIGPPDALASLRAQVSNGNQVQTFTDHQVREAVEYIATYKPSVVAVDEAFAVSPRGEALMGRIMDDSSLSKCGIRILARAAVAKPEREKTRKKSGAGITPALPFMGSAAAAEAVAVSAPLDRRGTRRAERIRMLTGVSITVDGNPAELVDLSAAGAQVVSKIDPATQPAGAAAAARGESRGPPDAPVLGIGACGRPSRCRPGSRRGIAPASSSPATKERPCRASPTGTERRRQTSRTDASGNQRAAMLSSRTMVSSRSEPVDTIATGTPLTSSSRAM